MAGTFKFELVSPERVLLSLDADQVVVPGAEGEFAVLAGHAPALSTLRPGVLDVTAGGVRKKLFVKSGFAEVDPERLTVLSDAAYDVEEMTSAVIAEETRLAEEQLANANDDVSRMMADTLLSELKRVGAGA